MNPMRRMRLWIALFAAAPFSSGQSELTPETILLARIRYHMSQMLQKQPNYTCQQSIERSRRRAASQKYEIVDTVRLEVALVGSRELFSWPGAGKFEEVDIADMVRGGAIGNGNFALHARSVFLSSAATFIYAGEVTHEGRRAVKFDYKIPQYRSGYSVRMGEIEAVVGYIGAFWADPETLDLIRLEVSADDIPPQLPVSAASDAMEYERVRIGDGNFLLPASSDMRIADLRGNESRNRTRFMNCRQYTGESVLTFEDLPEEETPLAKSPPAQIEVPEGLELDLKLMTPVDSSKNAVGDAVEAVVDRAAKRNGRVIVPKGAAVKGRITRLEHRPRPAPHYIIALDFSTLEFEGHQAVLHGTVQSVSRSLVAANPAYAIRQLERAYRESRDNTLFEPGTRLRMPRGWRFVWRAGAASTEEIK